MTRAPPCARRWQSREPTKPAPPVTTMVRKAQLSYASAAESLAWASTATNSAPAEQALDVGELQLHVGGAAVVALAGVGRRLHLAQERVHLRSGEAAARA